MAARPGPPRGPAQGPQYALPKHSAEEQFVQKKQGEFIQGDVRMLSGCDVERPFSSLEDAVKRLLPFHLFNAVDASEADLDDTPDHCGADLMSNRHEAWQELCISKANELRNRADNRAAQVANLEQQLDADVLSGTRPFDKFAMVKLQQEDLKRKVAAERAKLQQLMPAQPVAVVAAPAAAGAGSKAAAVAAPAQQILVAPGQQGVMIQAMQRQQQLQAAAAQQQAALSQLPAAQRQQLLQQQQLQLQQYAYLQQLQQAQLMQQLQQQQAKKH